MQQQQRRLTKRSTFDHDSSILHGKKRHKSFHMEEEDLGSSTVAHEAWSTNKEMEASKQMGVLCMVLQLDRRLIDAASDHLFWDKKQFRNIPMVHALGLVIRWMSKSTDPQTSIEFEYKWRKLWSMKVQLRATMFVMALYVAIKQIEVFKGDPQPMDVCKALSEFNVKTNVEMVNKMEIQFLNKLEWRTHLDSRPRPFSSEAQLSGKVQCKYDMIVSNLLTISESSSKLFWHPLYAMYQHLNI